MRRIGRDMEPNDIREFVDSPNPILLEIGCNDGTDTNKFLEAFPGGTIYCFEPDPRAISRFFKTVHSERARLFAAAISDTDGQAVFNGSSGRPPGEARGPGASHYCFLDEWDLSGSLHKPTGHLSYSPWVTFPESRRFDVKTMRLDTWLEDQPEIGVIDFIWADVQGAEATLIAGAQNALRNTRYFYTETRLQQGQHAGRELYQGQPSIEEIQASLPFMSTIAHWGNSNILLKNNAPIHD